MKSFVLILKLLKLLLAFYLEEEEEDIAHTARNVLSPRNLIQIPDAYTTYNWYLVCIPAIRRWHEAMGK